MAYTRTTWQDSPSTSTPINATRLNNVEQGLVDAHNFSVICTSSTRPASPFVGQRIYETDTRRSWTYITAAWVPDDGIFATEAARDAAIPAPFAGQRAFITGTSLATQYNGTVWTSSLPAFLSAAGTDVTAGAFSGNIIYTFATITLTPGTWLVTGGMSLENTTTSDATSVGVYNRTTSTEVASSRGASGVSNTTTCVSLLSRQVSITVATNTQVCPLGTRNGSSTIKPNSASGGAPGYIQALRISIP